MLTITTKSPAEHPLTTLSLWKTFLLLLFFFFHALNPSFNGYPTAWEASRSIKNEAEPARHSSKSTVYSKHSNPSK